MQSNQILSIFMPKTTKILKYGGFLDESQQRCESTKHLQRRRQAKSQLEQEDNGHSWGRSNYIFADTLDFCHVDKCNKDSAGSNVRKEHI